MAFFQNLERFFHQSIKHIKQKKTVATFIVQKSTKGIVTFAFRSECLLSFQGKLKSKREKNLKSIFIYFIV